MEKWGISISWRFGPVALVGFMLFSGGCSVIRETVRLPNRAVSAVMPGSEKRVMDPAALQADLQRFADEYVSRTTVALDAYAKVAATAEARAQALKWKVAINSAVVGIASGPNPVANVLDLVVMATVTRIAIEEVWRPGSQGAAFQPWEAASRELEKTGMTLAGVVLSPAQLDELREVIRAWWASNPEAHTGFLIRPEVFLMGIRQDGEKAGRAGSVFAWVGLDPTAGLDPAVREVTRTRLFAERALYAAQRAPFLLRWQIDLVTDQFFGNPEVTNLIASVRRFSEATESASGTLEQLPERLVTERKAILAAFEEQEGRLRELSAELGRTLAAGEKMSGSVNTTLVTFDALMKRFGVGEPRVAAPEKEGPPFRIQDYGETAEKLDVAARRLTELLRTLDQTLGSTNLTQLPGKIQPVVDEARSSGKELVDYAFWRGVMLTVIAVVAALVYRFLVSRIQGRRTKAGAA